MPQTTSFPLVTQPLDWAPGPQFHHLPETRASTEGPGTPHLVSSSQAGGDVRRCTGSRIEQQLPRLPPALQNQGPRIHVFLQ